MKKRIAVAVLLGPLLWAGSAAAFAVARSESWHPRITGFFCTARPVSCLALPTQHPDQALIWNLSAGPCGPGAVLLVTRGTRKLGDYVDDSLGTREAPARACAVRFHVPVWAGELTFGSIVDYPNWHSPQLPNGLQEWYPVRTHAAPIGPPPPPGSLGYILQAFSWSDSATDRAVMGDTNQAPSVEQERQMWCAALRQHPRVVLWYYATRQNVPELLRIERQPCPKGGGMTARRGG